MIRVSLAVALALSAAACAYRPSPTEVVRIVDSPIDVTGCTRLGEVSSGNVPTTSGFGAATEAMLQATVALGGTDLLLHKRSHDWLLVRGIAYRCGPVVREQVVVRAAG